MVKKDPRVDTYIMKSAGFAVPILSYLRDLVHAACPEAEETMKWSFPHFQYKGRILCSMASFKQHCALSIWLGALLDDPGKYLTTADEKISMGSIGRITSLDDLPPAEVLVGFFTGAAELIDRGAKIPKEKKVSALATLEIPEYFSENLKKDARAEAVFKGFSYSQKKEYVTWVMEAKTDATREKRMATSLEWLAEGKIRNWKYLR